MVEHALRRELTPLVDQAAGLVVGASGLPCLAKRGSVNPNAELHRRLAEGDVEDAIAWLDRAPSATKRGG